MILPIFQTIRTATGCNSADLARRWNCSVSAVSRYENGQRPVPDWILTDLTSLYGELNPEWLPLVKTILAQLGHKPGVCQDPQDWIVRMKNEHPKEKNDESVESHPQ